MSFRAWIAAGTMALAACGGSGSDPWRYEKILYEEAPEVRSREDAGARVDALAAKPELTLDDCYRMAIHRAETLALNGEELVRLQTQYEQVLAAVLPRASFRASYTRQDNPGSSTSSDGVQRSFTLEERTEYKFFVRQPIFSGLREFYALRQGRELRDAKEHDLRHAKLLLFADAADAFYAVLQIDRDLATTQDSLKLAEERLEELVQRNRAGISRRSEVLAQEAEVASIRAASQRLEGALAVAWEVLKFLAGLPDRRALKDTLPEPGDLPPVADYVARALRQRHDLRALERQIAAAEEGVGIARAGYLPVAALEANYYTHREGISENIDWDLVLSLEIPIFEGGTTQARLREARSFIRSARLDAQRRRREVELEVNRFYADARSFGAELASLDKAVASAQENYDIVQAEYRQNIVTNIEVLTAFNVLQRARLDRDRARYQAKLARVRLDVQSGELSEGAK